MDTETNNEGEVKEFVQKVNVNPSEDDEEETDDEENDTQPQSSEDENEPESDDSEPEESDEEPEEQVAEAPKKEPKPVDGETPRERALRLETTRLKGLLRQQRQDELFVQKPLTQQLSLDDDLKEYDPEELKRFEFLATKMGFAKKDEINHQTIQTQNATEFENFIEAHPEYAPENDKDGTLWAQFRSEFSLYTPPQDPKVLRKVLNKVHNEIFGVQPAANLTKINAQREKIKVASHTGASAGKTAPKERPLGPSGLRMDAMKGFSEDELKDLLG